MNLVDPPLAKIGHTKEEHRILKLKDVLEIKWSHILAHAEISPKPSLWMFIQPLCERFQTLATGSCSRESVTQLEVSKCWLCLQN